MNPWLILVGIVVASVAGWYLIQLGLSFEIPQSRSGRLYLEAQLKQRGVSVERLPDEFFAECVGFAEAASMVERTRVARKAEFVRGLDSIASMVGLWRRDQESPMFATHSGRKSTYRAIFEKYEL